VARRQLRRLAITDCWREPLEDDGTVVVLCAASKAQPGADAAADGPAAQAMP
jgi:hypothetical protein